MPILLARFQPWFNQPPILMTIVNCLVYCPERPCPVITSVPLLPADTSAEY